MLLPSAALSVVAAMLGEATRAGAVARPATTRPTAIRPAQKIRRMERIVWTPARGSAFAGPRVDVGLDVLCALPGRRAGLQLALGGGGVSLGLRTVTADDRHLGAGERGHAGVVEPGVARRHQPPHFEAARLGLLGLLEVAHRLAVIVGRVGLEQGAGGVA